MTINVYYASYHNLVSHNLTGLEFSVDLLLTKIESLNKNLPDWYKQSMLRRCPASTDVVKQCYVMKFNYDIDFGYYSGGFYSNDERIMDYTSQSVDMRESELGLFQFLNTKIFFADKPLTVTTLHPYLHSNDYTKHFNTISAEFDIGRWFRPIVTAAIKKHEEGNVSIRHGDITSYIRFNTKEKIKFHEFKMTNELDNLKAACTFHQHAVSGISQLKGLYELFESRNRSKRILKAIKNNLID